MPRLPTLAPLLCALALSSSAHAGVIWRGDFETGDLSQWSKAQIVSADRMQVVTSPVTQGRYAVKVTVKQGDNPIGASGNRNELLYLSYEPQGTERWYRWQTMWDPSYPSVATWQLFTQWHHSGDSGSPPFEMYVNGETIYLRVNTDDILWTQPLVRGVWHDFLLHVKWSPDPSEGFVEMWFDGQLAIPLIGAPTQFAGMTNYLKQGLYRNDTITEDGIVYHDGFTVGEARQDVDPVSVEPDAGAVAPPAGPDASAPAPAGPDASAPVAAGPDAAAPEQPGPDAGPAAGVDAAVAVTPDDAGALAAADAGSPTGKIVEPPPAGCSAVPGSLVLPAALLGLSLLVRRRR